MPRTEVLHFHRECLLKFAFYSLRRLRRCVLTLPAVVTCPLVASHSSGSVVNYHHLSHSSDFVQIILPACLLFRKNFLPFQFLVCCQNSLLSPPGKKHGIVLQSRPPLAEGEVLSFPRSSRAETSESLSPSLQFLLS